MSGRGSLRMCVIVPKWQLALEIIDELLGWGLERRVVQADGGYGDITAFRVGLEERDLEYVVQVKGVTSAQPADATPVTPAYKAAGRPRVARYPEKPLSLRELGARRRPRAVRTSAGAKVTAARSPASSSRSGSAPPTTPNASDDGVLPERWLLAEWPEGKDEPVKYWLSNLPADTPLLTLVQLAKLRWRVEHDYRELKQCLGLDHYEGRTYRGLHHHLTCVTVAHAFLTCCRLARGDPRPPSAGGSLISLYQAQRDLQTALACWHGHCPTCQRRLPP